jgi:hypothetical protein
VAVEQGAKRLSGVPGKEGHEPGIERNESDDQIVIPDPEGKIVL